MKVNGKYDGNENVWIFKIMLTDMTQLCSFEYYFPLTKDIVFPSCIWQRSLNGT